MSEIAGYNVPSTDFEARRRAQAVRLGAEVCPVVHALGEKSPEELSVLDTDTALTVYDTVTPEYYGQLSPLIDDIVNLVLDGRELEPPFDVSESLQEGPTENSPCDKLGDYIRNSFFNPVFFFEDYFPPDKVEQFRALDNILNQRVALIGGGHMSLKTSLSGGVNTATINMALMLKSFNLFLADKFPEGLDPKDAVDIARKSVSPLVGLASLNHIRLFLDRKWPPSHPSLVGADGALRPHYFKYDEASRRINFARPVLQLPVAPGTLFEDLPATTLTIGCPILLNPQTLVRLWQWMVDIADQNGLIAPKDSVDVFSN